MRRTTRHGNEWHLRCSDGAKRNSAVPASASQEQAADEEHRDANDKQADRALHRTRGRLNAIHACVLGERDLIKPGGTRLAPERCGRHKRSHVTRENTTKRNSKEV